MKPECEPPISTGDDASVTDQERLDEAMFESFPASDPPSWNAGLSHEQAHAAEDAGPTWKQVKRTLMQVFNNLTDEDFICEEGQEAVALQRIAQKLNKPRAEIESLLRQ